MYKIYMYIRYMYILEKSELSDFRCMLHMYNVKDKTCKAVGFILYFQFEYFQ